MSDEINHTLRGQDGTPCAMWTCELTAEELEAIAKGVSPLSIRPDALVYYRREIIVAAAEEP